MWKTSYGSLDSGMSGNDSDSDVENKSLNIISNNDYLLNNNKNYKNIIKYVLILIVLVFSTIFVYSSINTRHNVFLLLINKSVGHTTSLPNQSTDTVNKNQLPTNLPPKQQQTNTLDTSNTLLFTLNRLGYPAMSTFTEHKSKYLYYTFLSNYKGIIEPHASMQLLPLNEDSNDYNYSFEICDYDTKSDCRKGSKLANQLSDTFTFECTPHTVYKIKVLEFNALTNIKTDRMADSTVICMYVRREIEALTDDDLADTLDALHAMWEYSDEEGQALYGKKFHSASYFSEAHHFNSAWQMSDHIHEGLGFIPQHIKLTNFVENVMQAINPAVTMPYWEFTKEVAEGKTIFDSYMFTEKTFGSLTQPSDQRMGFQYKHESYDLGAIPNGRWANLLSSPTRFEDILSGYGFLKAPWSMNPSKYVTRYASLTPGLPSCTNYYRVLSMSNSFTSILDTIQKDPHASVHSVIGNTYGCDKFEELRTLGLIINDDIAHIGMCKSWSYLMKDLYRNNYIKPDTSCSNTARSLLEESTEIEADSSSSISRSISPRDNDVCGYVCNADTHSKLPAFLQSMVNKKYVPSELTNDDWNLMRDFVCSGGASQVFIGTHMESASSADPSFWPVHPTQERLLQAKFIANNIKLEDMVWPASTSEGYICETPNCFIEEYNSNEKGYYEECCYGHYQNDQLLNFVTGDPNSYFGETNHEVLLATNPLLDSYSMNYVYDEFDWSHCTGDDDIMALLKTQYLNHKDKD